MCRGVIIGWGGGEVSFGVWGLEIEGVELWRGMGGRGEGRRGWVWGRMCYVGTGDASGGVRTEDGC
jgi:hypothetical protein